VKGTVEVFPEYATGLRDLDGFERIGLVYWFDRAREAELVVTPYLDDLGAGSGYFSFKLARVVPRERW
jgi:tRNA (adenine37-N6)-methyltransferase